MKRVILHCDLNCFFASVEMAKNPELRNVPMAVVGNIKDRHGIILTKNKLAKKYNLITGEPIWQAVEKCSDLTLVPANYKDYQKFSKKVKAIYYDYTDNIESFGIDECWLDVSKSLKLFKSEIAIAKEILNRVKAELNLTLSIGIANNKIFAKLASDEADYDQYLCFYDQDIERLIYPLHVSKLMFVGRQTTKVLAQLNIETIKDLAEADPNILKIKLGKMGSVIQLFAKGQDISSVSYLDSMQKVKSVSNTITAVKDLKSIEDVKLILTILSTNIATRLKDSNLYAKTVRIVIKDNNLHFKGFQMPFPYATDLAKDIYKFSLELYQNKYHFDKDLRAISIKVSNLTYSKNYLQTSFFENYSDKQKQLETCLDDINYRFGNNSIFNLRLLCDSKIARLENEQSPMIGPVSYRL